MTSGCVIKCCRNSRVTILQDRLLNLVDTSPSFVSLFKFIFTLKHFFIYFSLLFYNVQIYSFITNYRNFFKIYYKGVKNRLKHEKLIKNYQKVKYLLFGLIIENIIFFFGKMQIVEAFKDI